MFTISPYSLVVLAHVAAATHLIGGSTFGRQILDAIGRATSLLALRLWLDFGRRSARANPVAALVVLVTGVYLGSFGWWAQGWFYIAASVWVINTALAAAVVKPAAGALGAAAAGAPGAGIPPEVDALRRSVRWPVAAAVMQANDLVMLYVMFTKPSLAQSCGVVVGAAGLWAGFQLVRERRGRRGTATAAARPAGTATIAA